MHALSQLRIEIRWVLLPNKRAIGIALAGPEEMLEINFGIYGPAIVVNGQLKRTAIYTQIQENACPANVSAANDPTGKTFLDIFTLYTVYNMRDR